MISQIIDWVSANHELTLVLVSIIMLIFTFFSLNMSRVSLNIARDSLDMARTEFNKYKIQQARSYVGLFRVDIKSNLSMKYPILYPPKKDHLVLPKDIIDVKDGGIQKQPEEILVNLIFKNTGPIAAQNVLLHWFIIFEDSYTKEGEVSPARLINDQTNISFFKDIIDKQRKGAATIRIEEPRKYSYTALLPEQEITHSFMFKPEAWIANFNVMDDNPKGPRDGKGKGTNNAYIICDIEYESTSSDKHSYFGVYKLSHYLAWTRIYHATLIQSDIK